MLLSKINASLFKKSNLRLKVLRSVSVLIVRLLIFKVAEFSLASKYLDGIVPSIFADMNH